jgi:hypothetical protein
VARALLRLYPSAWRNQYGAELADLLETHDLPIGSVVDIVRGALWQRLRTISPAMVLGGGAMLVVLSGVVLSPTAYGSGGTALIQPSHITFPAIRVTFFSSELFALLLVVCGFWTHRRRGHGSAKAAMWMTLVAGLPVTVFGILMLAGAVTATIPLPSEPNQVVTPLPWALILAPPLRMFESALWGAVGGQLCRWFTRRTDSAAAV